MKSHLLLGLGLVSSLVCGTVATADLQELDYRIVANNAVAGDNNWTFEIYGCKSGEGCGVAITTPSPIRTRTSFGHHDSRNFVSGSAASYHCCK